MISSQKENTSRLNLRNIRTSLRNSCLEFHNFIYYSHLYTICVLVSIEELPYEYHVFIYKSKIKKMKMKSRIKVKIK